jgi:hypothetical protein
MKEGRTRIVIILDRSGSMASVRESTVAGFNEFIRTQRAIPGDVSVKLVQFDNEYEVVFDQPLAEAPELNQDRFVPRGSTALFDAQGRTIVALGEELAAMPEEERPAKVIVVTLTDGLENASRTYTLETVASLIKQQMEKYGWDFVFLGANQDAVQTAASMNIPMPSAMTYRSNPAATRNVFQAAAGYVSASRSGGQALFSREARKAAMADDDGTVPADVLGQNPAPPAPPRS